MKSLVVAIAIAIAIATVATVSASGAAHAAQGTMKEVTSFGSNPGGLKMFEYVPAGASGAGRPLVVVMHGCSQGAADAFKIGFAELADLLGYLVVYPEQTTSNNPIKCFNWAGEYGDPANLERGKGENESIRQMVQKMIDTHGVDPARVYITGFSAGGAFVAVMLATWPDLFAGGAILSGVPYRCATTVNGAYNCQALGTHAELKKTPAQWGDLVRSAHPGYAGARPRVLIMHGTGDGIVHPDNQTELLEQWTNVLGADQSADETAMVGNHERTRHRAGSGGAVVVESWRVVGMGHAVPMGGGDPEHGCAPAGTYVEDRQLCGAWRVLGFWGLTGSGPGPGPGPDAGPGSPDGGVAFPPPADAGPTTPPPPGAPSVTLVAPSAGAELDGAVTVEATASDSDGVQRVEFWIDGVLKGSDGSPPYTWLWQTASYEPGPHEVKVIAYDVFATANEDSATVEILDGAGGSGGGAGGDELVDPIACGCRAGGARGSLGALAAIAVVIAAWAALAVLSRRPRRRGGAS